MLDGDESGVEYGPASTSVCSEYVRVIFLFFALASSSPVSTLLGSGWLCDSSWSLGWLVRPYFCLELADSLPLLLELAVRDTVGRGSGELGGDGDVTVAVTEAFVMMSSSLWFVLTEIEDALLFTESEEVEAPTRLLAAFPYVVTRFLGGKS